MSMALNNFVLINIQPTFAGKMVFFGLNGTEYQAFSSDYIRALTLFSCFSQSFYDILTHLYYLQSACYPERSVLFGFLKKSQQQVKSSNDRKHARESLRSAQDTFFLRRIRYLGRIEGFLRHAFDHLTILLVAMIFMT